MIKNLCLSALTGAALFLGVNYVRATGAVGVNPPQSGTATFTNNVFTNTITFPYPFQVVPVVTSYYLSGPTNMIPLTNALITTTNFNLEINSTNGLGAGTTNGLIAWQAYVGSTRIEAGSNAVTAQVPLLITFPNAYAVPPLVVASGNATNALSVGVSGITSTNFTVASPGSQMVSWISVGTDAYPPSPNTGVNPGLNTVIY